VAEWAGHLLDVLSKTYAKCLSGQEDIAGKRLAEAFRTN
jgi:hypothetical protein